MPDTVTVVDASLVVKAILPNPEISRCQAVLEQLQGTPLVAPALWMYEITSAIAKAVHFGQITPEDGKAALHHALALGVQVILPDETQSNLAYDLTLKLERAAAYDSFYLAIAESLQAEFWTADQRLVRSLQNQRPAWLHFIED
jgi:predicted nucleic acid-binding protein